MAIKILLFPITYVYEDEFSSHKWTKTTYCNRLNRNTNSSLYAGCRAKYHLQHNYTKIFFYFVSICLPPILFAALQQLGIHSYCSTEKPSEVINNIPGANLKDLLLLILECLNSAANSFLLQLLSSLGCQATSLCLPHLLVHSDFLFLVFFSHFHPLDFPIY